jgi:UDP-N-acetylmuramoyl-L-alanyl-D-glutamate--2,6-diaminopimelate ligase
MWQKIKNYFHLLQAVIANIIYGFPARKLTVIGVTGTDGKTTTTSLIYHIIKSSGKKAAMITSVGAYIGDKVYDIGFHVTTPSSFGLQKYIKKAVEMGVKFLVLETTSHALDQNRVWGIPYEIGVLTNITHEHLDYHKTYEEYAKAKFKLLVNSEWKIVNRDDESYNLIMRFGSQIKFNPSSISTAEKLNRENPKEKMKPDKFFQLTTHNHYITYSIKNSNADFTPIKFPYKTSLIGEFNVYNSLAAIAAAKTLGINDTDIRKALLTFSPPPGRQEIIYDKSFRVMIDFAHTPNAFAVILPEIKKITQGRVIHVFGSAGKRDFTKRPEMGEKAAKFDDVIILTAEDPRDEKVEEISGEISSGIKGFIKGNNKGEKGNKDNQKILYLIPVRKEAIEFAISLAQKGDTVILTGKSHEKSMNLGHGEEPWDEFEIAKKALEKS